jgi:hypothetical protein
MFLLEMSGDIKELKNMEESPKRIKEHLRQQHECPVFNSFINK